MKSIIPSFARAIKSNTTLETIQWVHNEPVEDILQYTTNLQQETFFERTDSSEVGGIPVGSYIRSLKHDTSDELIHIRSWTNLKEIADYPITSRPPFLSSDFTSITSRKIEKEKYDDENGNPKEKVYELLDYMFWEDATYYDGEIVPMEIIGDMMRAAGVKVGEWEGRGVEVGEKAWKVLTDWRESMKKL